MKLFDVKAQETGQLKNEYTGLGENLTRKEMVKAISTALGKGWKTDTIVITVKSTARKHYLALKQAQAAKEAK